ncbi:MAG: methylglyoxal synthase [Clostridia bacterium]|nr:methylglyoxal synthase [Clostridia bacterium]MBO4798986.1 methylglyoxal synthase [Candidatus Methanomethylophilaceae archaeon]MBQ4289905.1 methylglyoxal synthase [Clostridia bacterium]
MEIALIAHDSKKELMTQFCIAYCGVLSKHSLYSTSITAKYVSEGTGLQIERLLPGKQGGIQQITSRIAYDEIDMVLFFRSTNQASSNEPDHDELETELIRMCDLHNVPIATNIATAEALISALDRGDFDWRKIVNPKSEYNRR